MYEIYICFILHTGSIVTLLVFAMVRFITLQERQLLAAMDSQLEMNPPLCNQTDLEVADMQAIIATDVLMNSEVMDALSVSDQKVFLLLLHIVLFMQLCISVCILA